MTPSARHPFLRKTAVWALTPQGARLGEAARRHFPIADLFLPAALAEGHDAARRFFRLVEDLPPVFPLYEAHIFIMSAGIVVRTIAPLIRHKTIDPAVVVMDETGRFCISLLSGHLGGANALADALARAFRATPVITTATDLHQVPAIDMLAVEQGLVIENPSAIKTVSMAFLKGESVWLHDPHHLIREFLPKDFIRPFHPDFSARRPPDGPGVFADDMRVELPGDILMLRPPSLTAGLGCNRHTPAAEMRTLLTDILEMNRLSVHSLAAIATIDIKRGEPGITELAADLGVPVLYYDRDALKKVGAIETPSEMAAKHVGVPSVCEAAAILGSGNGNLIVPKRKSKNATAAIARRIFTSSASDRATTPTSPPGP